MKAETLTLTDEDRRNLESTRDHDPPAYLRERAAALLKIHRGQTAHAVALRGLLKPRDPDTLYAWLDRYQQAGLAGLTHKPRRKRRLPA